jgi:ribosomal protein S18 acetylase RimI-like enzyme
VQIRTATADDRQAVREVAQRSLQASYSLSPGTIESAISEWYGESGFADRLDDDDVHLLVADGDGVVGFAEGVVVAEGADVSWLHVHPEHRGLGVGSDLFEAIREELTDAGASYLRGRVLDDNRAGNTFYEELGFERADQERVEIDGEPYVENLYLEVDDSGDLEEYVTDDGETLYVDRTDEEVGSEAPFHIVYADPDGERRHALYCANCDGVADTMATSGRVRCATCGNTRKPTRWDSSHM